MDYEDANGYECEAMENDWLDISYVKRNYINEEKEDYSETDAREAYTEKKTAAKRKRKKPAFKLPQHISKRAVVLAMSLVLVVAVFTGFMFLSGMSIGTLLTQARQTFLNVIDRNPAKTLTLPAVATVENITDGDIILTGGSVAMNMKAGTVGTVTEDSVSVDVGEGTVFVYSGLSEIFVESGQALTMFDVVGRYDEMALVSIFHNGVKITNVTNDGRKIIWRET